jgi:uncharacterized protein (TIGR00251 family)
MSAAKESVPALLTLRKDGTVQMHIAVKPGCKIASVSRTPETIVVRTMKPAREGEANDDVIKQLSKSIGIPKSQLAIVAGSKGREKIVVIAGVSLEAVLSTIPTEE